jgi:hypothetical protein
MGNTKEFKLFMDILDILKSIRLDMKECEELMGKYDILKS